MITFLSAGGLVENLIKIDIRWLLLPVGLIGIWLTIEVVRSILRQKKNKGIKDPLDCIEEAITLDGKNIDELTEDKEHVFNVMGKKLEKAAEIETTEVADDIIETTQMPSDVVKESEVADDVIEATEIVADVVDAAVIDTDVIEEIAVTAALCATKESKLGTIIVVPENTEGQKSSGETVSNTVKKKLIIVKSKKEKDKTLFTSDIIYVDDKTVVLPKCFESRLKLSSEAVKMIYSALKNTLLSYDGIYSRILRSVEVFRKNGVWARIRIKAKSLYLYLNIEHSLCSEELKYRIIDNVRGLEGTPIEIKVSGKLKLKRSIELIEKMFYEANIQKNPKYLTIDYVTLYPTICDAIMDNINVVKMD
ncbi:MAG: hypothetical protein EOM87_02780 [Clostridia bacterium]|nr:hypothetical protein [Clostridia bacterium]